jgi:uncharacterized membrane protein
MKTENVVLMQMARESLKGKWGLAIKTFVVYFLIFFILQFIPIIGPIASLIISGPFTLGLAIFSLSISRNQDAKLEQIFLGFNNFGTALGAYLLRILFTLLWMLLLIIPGIIAAISYSMTFYILADDNSIGAMDAIDKSKKIMYGYKWKYFCLQLRFLGLALLCILTLGIGFLWLIPYINVYLLCILTLGIGFLWLIPYINVCMAKFYDDIKANSLTTENL